MYKLIIITVMLVACSDDSLTSLPRASRQHKLWVDSSGAQGKRADLIGANLRGVDLSDAILVDISIRDAKYDMGHILNKVDCGSI